MKKIIALLIMVCIAKFVSAQEDLPYIKKSFLIVTSVKSYAAAKKTALRASEKLNLKSDLRDLTPNKQTGLTYSKTACENEGGYPCYIARGRYDDGEYVSIEWSNAFSGFSKGYYIVVIYSGDNTSGKGLLEKAKKIFNDAYLKETDVYVGCMH